MKSWLKFNQKGNFDNYFVILLFLFIFGFVSILGMTMYSSMSTAFNETGLYDANMQQADTNFTNAYKLFDYIIVIILICLTIGIVLTSYKLNTAPVFFVVYVAVAAFFTLVAYMMNHIFIQMVSDSIFTDTLKYFPKTLVLCTNLHWVALFLFVVGSIALYAKKESTSDIQGGAF